MGAVNGGAGSRFAMGRNKLWTAIRRIGVPGILTGSAMKGEHLDARSVLPTSSWAVPFSPLLGGWDLQSSSITASPTPTETSM